MKEEITEKFLEFEDTDGKRPVKRVLRKEELYPGSSRYIPDLFIETDEDYAPDFRAYDKVVIQNSKYIHDPYGIFIAYGKDVITKKEEIKGLEIVDITPTVLHLFNMPVSPEMDGKVLRQIFQPSSEPDSREVKYAKLSMEEKQSSTSPHEEEIIKEKLKSLGYLG